MTAINKGRALPWWNDLWSSFINLKYTGISTAGEDEGLIVPHYILLNIYSTVFSKGQILLAGSRHCLASILNECRGPLSCVHLIKVRVKVYKTSLGFKSWEQLLRSDNARGALGYDNSITYLEGTRNHRTVTFVQVFFHMGTVHKSRFVYVCVSLWLNITLSQFAIN